MQDYYSALDQSDEATPVDQLAADDEEEPS